MKKILRKGLFLFLLFILTQHQVHAETVIGGVNNWFPWQGVGSDGNGVGIAVEIFKTAITRIGHEPDIKIVPIKRNPKHCFV